MAIVPEELGSRRGWIADDHLDRSGQDGFDDHIGLGDRYLGFQLIGTGGKTGQVHLDLHITEEQCIENGQGTGEDDIHRLRGKMATRSAPCPVITTGL